MRKSITIVVTIMLMLSLCLIGCDQDAASPTETPKSTQSAKTTPTTTPKQSPPKTYSPEQLAAAELSNKNLLEKVTKKDMIEIVLENGKIMTAELYPEIAPLSVANFLKLVDAKFYDGLIFHRVIPGFMIQGGGFDTTGKQKQAESIKGEFQSNGVKNDLKHERGVLSMARTSVPDSGSSQFFIMVDYYPSLDGEYAAFGKVIDGMDAADEIVNQPRGAQDKPVTNQVIKTIRRK